MMRWVLSFAVGIFVGLASAHAVAGTVEQAMTLADPQMQVKGGVLQGCGYRLKSMPESMAGRSSILLLDASFNIYAQGLALLKAGALQVEIRNGNPGSPVVKPISSFWLKAQGESPTAALDGKFIPAEDNGYLLAGIDAKAVVALFNAIWEDAPVTIGVRVRGEAIDRIYSGIARLSAKEKANGRDCFEELMRQMRRALPDDGDRKK